MARFRVELIQSIVETAVVWLEATNEQQAEELALAQVTTGSGAEWKFKDALDGIEILSTQQITPETTHD
jgi:hypothetical protein